MAKHDSCGQCCGTGVEEVCAACHEIVDNCECEFPEGDPPGVDSEECPGCEGTGKATGFESED